MSCNHEYKEGRPSVCIHCGDRMWISDEDLGEFLDTCPPGDVAFAQQYLKRHNTADRLERWESPDAGLDRYDEDEPCL